MRLWLYVFVMIFFLKKMKCSACRCTLTSLAARACRYLKVSWSSHACQTFAHISTADKKARGLMQHRGSLDVRQAGDWPYAASELHHSPVPGPVAYFTFNQPDPQLPCHTDCLSINMGTARCLLGQ